MCSTVVEIMERRGIDEEIAKLDGLRRSLEKGTWPFGRGEGNGVHLCD
jgi:hypothetical protein